VIHKINPVQSGLANFTPAERTEWAYIGGRLFFRNMPPKLAAHKGGNSIDSTSRLWYRPSGETAGGMRWDVDPTPPHLMCECGSDTFVLSYGDYQLIATCTNCQYTESVFDG